MTRLRRGCVSWLLDRGEKVTTPAKPVLLLLVISCYIMSCHVMQNHVAPFHMTSCHAAPTPPLLPELPSATKCYACDAKRHQVPGNTQRRPDYYALKSCYYERHAQAPNVAPATRNGARPACAPSAAPASRKAPATRDDLRRPNAHHLRQTTMSTAKAVAKRQNVLPACVRACVSEGRRQGGRGVVSEWVSE